MAPCESRGAARKLSLHPRRACGKNIRALVRGPRIPQPAVRRGRADVQHTLRKPRLILAVRILAGEELAAEGVLTALALKITNLDAAPRVPPVQERGERAQYREGCDGTCAQVATRVGVLDRHPVVEHHVEAVHEGAVRQLHALSPYIRSLIHRRIPAASGRIAGEGQARKLRMLGIRIPPPRWRTSLPDRICNAFAKPVPGAR